MSDDRHERVSRRAYELWEQQGGEHGRHEDHWHRASAEVDAPDASDADDNAADAAADPDAGSAEREQAVVAAPDGTTLTVAGEPAADAATPAGKRTAAKPAAGKAPAKPRKPKTK